MADSQVGERADQDSKAAASHPHDALPERAGASNASAAGGASRSRRSFGQLMRSWLIALMMLVVSLMLAVGPLAALVGALWAVGAAALALWRLAQLALAGAALTSSATPVYLRMLDVAGRGGFVALAYLALMFALMTLMAGLFGRRWGRLFALPGAVFTATAMVTLGLATFYAAPLLGALAIPPAWLLAAAAYLLVDVILVSGALVDASLTRSPTATGQHRAIPRTSVRKTSPPDALPT